MRLERNFRYWKMRMYKHIVIQSEAKNLDDINLCVSEILHYTSFRSE